LAEALALWRGPALAEFAFEPFAQAAIARLEERRLVALEERIAADLALGGHADLVGELEALIAKHPLRERLRGALMLALYRCGRQSEALHVYQETRRILVDELGIEPGPALQRVERSILQQDSALELVPVPEAASRRRRQRRRSSAARRSSSCCSVAFKMRTPAADACSCSSASRASARVAWRTS
jgi:DNA-binding SARP family transcriptional activator